MNKEKSRDSELYVKNHPKSPVSEAYRFIRTNLNYMNPDDPLKTIGITSSIEQEGKSTISSNLAKALAMDGIDVIAVDADLRKPMLNRFFGTINDIGLSDFLSNEANYDEIIKETNESNLDIITTGNVPPNPSELLGSNKMTILLEKLKNDYDKIILDTAPIVPVSDTVTLSPKLDGIILVVAAKQTNKEYLKKSKSLLDNVNANIIGSILNKYPVNSGGVYYKKYYHYYGSKK